ncbi:MAG: hypothetical protein FWE09_09265 [Treponema sp.]|nr:hypothetical protein [Treponema sp.]
MAKRFLFTAPAFVLALGLTLAGCAGMPSSFQKGSAGDTAILLRQGLDFDQAFREILFILTRHGFEPELMQSDAGYIRTRWNEAWVVDGSLFRQNNRGPDYRVRVVVSFNPNRTQLILSAPAEYLQGGRWVTGYDTRAIETLRGDLTMIVGN